MMLSTVKRHSEAMYENIFISLILNRGECARFVLTLSSYRLDSPHDAAKIDCCQGTESVLRTCWFVRRTRDRKQFRPFKFTSTVKEEKRQKKKKPASFSRWQGRKREEKKSENIPTSSSSTRGQGKAENKTTAELKNNSSESSILHHSCGVRNCFKGVRPTS